jgi:hypothetical protein
MHPVSRISEFNCTVNFCRGDFEMKARQIWGGGGLKPQDTRNRGKLLEAIKEYKVSDKLIGLVRATFKHV